MNTIFFRSVVNGFATAVGFLIAIVLMAGIREKIEYNDIPEAFQGTAIVLDYSMSDVNRIYGILRNDLGGKEDERYRNYFCSRCCRRCWYYSLDFSLVFPEKNSK